jgi:hypothetical protein
VGLEYRLSKRLHAMLTVLRLQVLAASEEKAGESLPWNWVPS